MKRTELKGARALLSVTLAFVIYTSLIAGATPALETFRAGAAAEPIDAELHQALLDLTNPWTVMCVAAHPDDEDGATLTVLRRKMGVHTVSLFSTYGEGGQNATGPELYEELGVIRARETEEASRIQGSEAHFLGLTDFGFSKSAEEAFRVWGKEEALRRMVLKIRELRPDVIITNHDTMSGHGHHQATGRLVLEAFEAAANPARFPEQLSGGRLQPWQAQRLFVRFSFNANAASTAAENQAQSTGRVITIDRNERDPVRGLSYAEQALQALRRHATQGPWPERLPAAGWPPIRYRLALEAKDAVKLPPDAKTFLDNLSIPDEPAGKVVPLAAQAVLPLYESQKAGEGSVLRSLVSLRLNNVFVAPAGTKDKARFQLMSERLDRALAAAAGVSAELKPEDDSPLIPGTRKSFQLFLHNRGENSVRIKRDSFSLNGRVLEGSTEAATIPAGHSLRRGERSYDVPQTAVVNVPQAEHLYDGRLSGAEFGAEFLLEVEGAPFKIRTTRRFNITPPVEIESISPSPLVVTPQTIGNNQDFTFRINNHTAEPYDVRVGSKELTYPGRSAEPRWERVPARSAVDNEVPYRISFQDADVIKQRGTLDTIARFSLYRVNPRPARETLITGRAVRIVYADARVDKALRVGYVRSTGYT
ncbi:MAG: PIG-L family deacetylase, partial [Acidobacteria bacterium]|nr:PIG-L family deacetylase [Acidobacteriota bacterium]